MNKKVKDFVKSLQYFFLEIRNYFLFIHKDWFSKKVEKEYKKIFRESDSSFVRKKGLFKTLIGSTTLWFFFGTYFIGNFLYSANSKISFVANMASHY